MLKFHKSLQGFSMRFYGRKEEISALQSFLETVKRQNVSQMVSVIGRRRVGKTTLILKAFEDEAVPFFYFFVSRRVSEADLVQAWLTEICRVFKLEFAPNLSSASEVIRFVMSLAKDTPCVCVIDECQELKTVQPSFFSQLQHLWDLNKDKSKLLLIMSGSIISAMEELFNASSQPLYGRSSGQLMVQPFLPSVIREIVLTENPKAKPMDLLAVYAITGGVARYLEILADEQCLTMDNAIQFIFSPQGGWLRSEGTIFLVNEYRADALTYSQILRAIANGATKWNEIQSQSELQISAYMRRLENFRLISKRYPIFEKPTARKAHYSIADSYMRFWLEFIDPMPLRALAEASRWSMLINYCQSKFSDFLGLSLESWFRSSYLEKGPWFEVGSWWDRTGEYEMDLVAVDPSEKRIEFGEVKLNPEKFNSIKLSGKVSRFLEAHPQYTDWTISVKGLFPENIL